MTPEEQAEKLVSEWRLAGTPIDDRLVRLVAAALAEKYEELAEFQLAHKETHDWVIVARHIADLRAENERLKKAATIAGTLELLEEANRRIDEYAELGRQDALEAARIELGGEISSLRGQLAEADKALAARCGCQFQQGKPVTECGCHQGRFADLRAEVEHWKKELNWTTDRWNETKAAWQDAADIGHERIAALEAQLADFKAHGHDECEAESNMLKAQLADLQQMNQTLWAALTPEKRHELNFAALAPEEP